MKKLLATIMSLFSGGLGADNAGNLNLGFMNRAQRRAARKFRR